VRYLAKWHEVDIPEDGKLADVSEEGRVADVHENKRRKVRYSI